MLLLLLSLIVLSGKGFCQNTKIVGGEAVTDRAEYAYQVSLQATGYGHFCGGSIIDSNHILTAAHCCYAFDNINSFIYSVTIEAGNLVLYDTNEYTVTRSVSAVYPHENYDEDRIANDICVVRVSTSFSNWTNNVQPINITNVEPSSGTNCTVSGWGRLSEISSISTTLQTVVVPIASKNICNITYSNSILDGMICAGYDEGGKDACQGDSGGPLVCNSELVGVVSWGSGCAREGYYGVYGDVTYYYSWINAKIANSSAITAAATLMLFVLPVQLTILYV